MIDLHVHSTHSDGTLTPAELIAAARAAGLTALALTDHDTVSGAPELLEAARGGPIRAVPGVELSAEFEPGTMHLLGYGFRWDDPALNAILSRLRDGRADRNRRILDLLAEHGMPMEMGEALACAGGESVGRPHIARAMMARGYVKSIEEAFERWLAKGRPAYQPRYRLKPEEAIPAISAAGGAAVLAHPVSLKIAEKELVALIRRLREAGLRGIEVWHPEHTAAQRRRYLQLAQDHGLVATGGSDFHGAVKPAIRLGRGFGDLRVPDEALGKLLGWRAADGG